MENNIETNVLKLTGIVSLVCHDSAGNLKWETGDLKNVIVNTGKAEVANLIGGVSAPVAFTYLALGTGSTGELASQTALVGEIVDSGLTRQAATVTRTTTTTTNDTVKYDYTWTASAAKTVEEIGIFNAASAGIMLGRKVTGSKGLSISDVLTATYKVIIS